MTELEKLIAEKGKIIDGQQAKIESLLVRFAEGVASQAAAGLTAEAARQMVKPFGDILLSSLESYTDIVAVLKRMARALGIPFKVTSAQNVSLVTLITARRQRVAAISRDIAIDLMRIAVENKIAGNTGAAIVNEIKNALAVVGRNAGTEVQTALSMFDRATMKFVYENAGIDKYVYFPPTLIETSRESCTSVVNDPRNISGEGFTKAEIAALPDVDFIRGGAPYYNCRHEWIPAFGRVSTTRGV